MGPFCRTTLNYISMAGPGQGRQSVDVEIHDGRSAELPGWQECGFELVSHPSNVSDWDDDEEVARSHYPEIEALAREMTGADRALVSAHIRRSPASVTKHQQLSPITFVHSDFGEGHIDIIRGSYRDPRPGVEAALSRNGITSQAVEDASRIIILQFWRNVGPARMDYPLAFCDARTVARAEGKAFRVTNYAGTGATFDALAVFAPDDPAAHEWYAFPEMEEEEVVAFRTYDTDLVRDGKSTYFTPHSAFQDPDVEPGNPGRHSIELRAHCLFA